MSFLRLNNKSAWLVKVELAAGREKDIQSVVNYLCYQHILELASDNFGKVVDEEK